LAEQLTIRSTTNARVKQVVRLQRDAGERRAAALFCIETERELRRALDAGFAIDTFWRAGDVHHATELEARAARQAATVIDAPSEVLQKIAYRDTPPRFVTILRAKRRGLNDLTLHRAPLLLICSGLEKPGNVGAMLRSAEAAGADAMLIDDPNVDLFNPNCIRASTGAVFSMPMVAETPANLRRWLAEHRIITLAATPEADLTHVQINLRPGVAFVLGAEAEGLNDAWKAAADLRVAIAMHGGAIDSLNVSTTAAVLLFEARRQRG